MKVGSVRNAKRRASGTASMRRSCRLPSTSNVRLTPVTLPPGRASERTKPAATISLATPTMGTVRVDSCAARIVAEETTFGVLVNPNIPKTKAERTAVQAAAQAIEQQVVILDVSTDRDIETAFATFVQRGVGALLG